MFGWDVSFAYLCTKNYRIMALIATLEFGDNDIQRYYKKYLVSDFRILHKRAYNKFNPEGMARCEQLQVSVICPGRDDLNLFEWYDRQGEQAGRVVIMSNTVRSSDPEVSQIIYLDGAKCFRLSESYDSNSNRRRILTLGIETKSIKVEQVEFKKD